MFKFGKPSISMGHKTPWQGFFYPRSPRQKPPAAATAAQPEVGISAEMVDEIPLKIVDSMDVLWMDFMDFSMDLSMDFSMDFFHGFHIWYQMFFGWIFPYVFFVVLLDFGFLLKILRNWLDCPMKDDWLLQMFP